MHGKKIKERIKNAVVFTISFFGGAFTLMAYHNDVSITEVFEQFYTSVMGSAPQSLTEVEWCYCIGILVGSGVFLKNAR